MTVTASAPAKTVMTPTTTDLFAPDNVVQGPLPQNLNPVRGGVGGTPTAAGQVAAQPTLEDALIKMKEDAAAAAGPERSAFYELPPPRSGIAGTQVGQRTAAGFDPESLRRPGFMESVKDMFVDTGSGKNFFEAGKDAFFPGNIDSREFLINKYGFDDAITNEAMELATGKSMGQLLREAATEISYNKLNPSFIRRFGPTAGAGLGILGLSGGFEGEDIPVPEDPFGLEGQSAFDLLAADPQKYRVFYSGGPYKLSDKPYGAAAGGSTDDFPRRDGAIAGPGTGTSDDIPAMLSDGEFVMTANAVRGAGNGDRKQGVRKMYEIMRTYEGVA